MYHLTQVVLVTVVNRLSWHCFIAPHSRSQESMDIAVLKQHPSAYYAYNGKPKNNTLYTTVCCVSLPVVATPISEQEILITCQQTADTVCRDFDDLAFVQNKKFVI